MVVSALSVNTEPIIVIVPPVPFVPRTAALIALSVSKVILPLGLMSIVPPFPFVEPPSARACQSPALVPSLIAVLPGKKVMVPPLPELDEAAFASRSPLSEEPNDETPLLFVLEL